MLVPKVEERIAQYLSFLESCAYRRVASLSFEVFATKENLREPPRDADWKPVACPAEYGEAWTLFWFRAAFTAPLLPSAPLYLQVTPNADSLAFLDGKPIGAFNPFHRKLRVAADGAPHVLHVEAYAGHPYPGMHPFQGESIMLTLSRQILEYPNVFEGGALLERLPAVYALRYDVRALYETARCLDADSLRRARILKGLYDALMDIRFSLVDDELEAACRAASARIAPLLACRNGPSAPEIHLIGHAHIDHAWLWHIAETERKAARTYANMARLAEEYPEFVFIQSQAAQLETVRREYPDVFRAVAAAYERGNWEPNGGMWVEADCNVTGGESLVRQFLYGKAATAEALGAEADTLWLPDVFGYAAALPQILAGCGIEFFVTSKIGWNDTTRFPYDTFLWRGIDGTTVKTHYLVSRTEGYNGRVSPAGLAETWHEVQHKELQSGALKSIGEGDGGGGTTRADLEMARRLVDLEGAPKASWRKVSDSLRRIFAERADWPVWRGELYLELHRGTYTTQARTKRWNRKLEFALRDAEFLSVLAVQAGLPPIPQADLDECWKTVLTNQFHDIIPGSSIGRVYAEAEAAYRRVDGRLAALAGPIRSGLAARAGGDLVAFNGLSWERRDPVVVDAAAVESAVGGSADGARGGIGAFRAPDGAVYPAQRFVDLGGTARIVCAPRLPPLGWSAFTAVPFGVAPGGAGAARAVGGDSVGAQGGAASPFAYDGVTLTTPFHRIRFDAAGAIESLVDTRRDAELVARAGRFNAFVSAEDVPVLWEAWDLEGDWTKSAAREDALLSSEVVADGPVCFRLRRRYRIGASSVLAQDTVVYADDPRIDFDTEIDWQERRRVLKVAFDTAVDAAQVRCEVQYGHVLRNAHRNLPQDRAMFEFCAHKWILAEEAGGGVALLNDCKYGHDAEGGRLRLTLLRAPAAPDPDADRGAHRFVYSLLPFVGAFTDSRVVESAYELNDPARAVPTSGPASDALPAAHSLCAVDGNAIVVEAIKGAEGRGGGGAPLGPRADEIALRLYESRGGRARTTLRFSRPLAAAAVTDMLERDGRALAFSGVELPLDFGPFEIKTLRVRFAPR